MLGGGVEAVVMNYYRHIDKNRVQFDFLVDSDSIFVPREEIEMLGGRVFEVPPYQHLHAYMRHIEAIFAQEGWPIVHSHINTLSVFPLRAAARAGVPVRIAHSHSTAGKGEHVKNALKYLLRTQANRYPTHRMACSRYAGEWLFGKDAKFDVLYNAIELDRFSFNAEVRAQARADLCLVGVEAQRAGVPCFLSDAITREVDVTGGVEFLPIDDPSVWANAISAIEPGSRIPVQSENFSDYEIVCAAEKLAGRYADLTARSRAATPKECR
ncbi:glycosyltransferase family 1 protein [Gordonibacter massiliensis]|nr:glycosyltransferase family 1 protein [Gordonibacter massiliensis (ex Traore et al. 2017)]